LANRERLVDPRAQSFNQWTKTLLNALTQIETICVALVACRGASRSRHEQEHERDPNCHTERHPKPESCP
jgi:hypothetical protein